jgi:hypothetical protein
MISAPAPISARRGRVTTPPAGDPGDPLRLQHTGTVRGDQPGRVTVVDRQRLTTEAQRDQRARIAQVRRRHGRDAIAAAGLE